MPALRLKVGWMSSMNRQRHSPPQIQEKRVHSEREGGAASDHVYQLVAAVGAGGWVSGFLA